MRHRYLTRDTSQREVIISVSQEPSSWMRTGSIVHCALRPPATRGADIIYCIVLTIKGGFHFLSFRQELGSHTGLRAALGG